MLLENDELRIRCHPEMGGKITSFYHKGKEFELAAQSGRRADRLPSAESGFGPYAFGMDDAFSNIDGESFQWKGRIFEYPDHGEIWRAGFEVTEQSEDSVRLCWKSPSFEYRYEKTLRLARNTLDIGCRITNEGEHELPCLWTWHGLMRYEEDMRLILPEGITECRNVLPGSLLGEAGKIYALDNARYDFTAVPKKESMSMVKFYAEQPVRRGRCGLYYPARQVACIMEYDAAVLPYFGVWITAGGYQGDYNCAMEPSNGFYDSVSAAWKNGRLPVLAAGEGMELGMKIRLE